MKFPCVIIECVLTANDRAAIMGGEDRDDIYNPKATDRKDAKRIRIVQTSERQGFPVLICESAGDCDAMGGLRWHKEEKIPWQMIAAVLINASSSDVRSAESFE